MPCSLAPLFLSSETNLSSLTIDFTITEISTEKGNYILKLYLQIK